MSDLAKIRVCFLVVSVGIAVCGVLSPFEKFTTAYPIWVGYLFVRHEIGKGYRTRAVTTVVVLLLGIHGVRAISRGVGRTRELATMRSAFQDATRLEITQGHDQLSITDRSQIFALKNLLASGQQFFPSHEGAVYQFQIEAFTVNRSRFTVNGSVRERHREDIVHEFKVQGETSFILIPGAARWLKQTLASKPVTSL